MIAHDTPVKRDDNLLICELVERRYPRHKPYHVKLVFKLNENNFDKCREFAGVLLNASIFEKFN